MGGRGIRHGSASRHAACSNASSLRKSHSTNCASGSKSRKSRESGMARRSRGRGGDGRGYTKKKRVTDVVMCTRETCIGRYGQEPRRSKLQHCSGQQMHVRTHTFCCHTGAVTRRESSLCSRPCQNAHLFSRRWRQSASRFFFSFPIDCLHHGTDVVDVTTALQRELHDFHGRMEERARSPSRLGSAGPS